uniref:WD repeat domain phosphoinositide-interacting protein 3 n=1 Tax=Echinostoma caproni TaxID=27848 RepID=A0A183AI89_9TREM
LEMLFRTNFLGILGGGHHSRLPSNVACLWDGIKRRFLLEITCASEVKAIRLRRDRIIVILSEAVKVYTFDPSPQLIYESVTCPNPLGLCHVCQAPDNPLIVFPGRRPGMLLLVHIGNPASSIASRDNPSPCGAPSLTSADNLPPRQIVAHENALAAIVLNNSGTLVATASQKGTLIRVFATKECELMYKFRRGINPATITSLAFNKSSDLLCVTSERGTAHIFCLKRDSTDVESRHASSSTGHIRSAISGASSYRLATQLNSPCFFTVLAADGSYYKYSFTPNGNVTRVTFVNFLDFYDEEADF